MYKIVYLVGPDLFWSSVEGCLFGWLVRKVVHLVGWFLGGFAPNKSSLGCSGPRWSSIEIDPKLIPEGSKKRS